MFLSFIQIIVTIAQLIPFIDWQMTSSRLYMEAENIIFRLKFFDTRSNLLRGAHQYNNDIYREHPRQEFVE